MANGNPPRRSLDRLAAVALVMVLGVASLRAQESQTATPVHIGSRLELFVDRHLIDTMQGVEFRLHEPRRLPLPRSPLANLGYTTVIRDGEVYRAYYRDTIPGYEGPTSDGNSGEITCYAESRDGHEWTFPDLGISPIRSPKGGNVILAEVPPCNSNFSPFLDTRPGVDKNERFKALAGARAEVHQRSTGRPGGGLYAFVSPDGIHWRRMGDEPVIPYRKSSPAGETRFDSQNVAFWSEAEQLYVCYFRTMDTPHGQLRTISRTTSPDFLNWSEPLPMHPNLPGEHLYTSQTHPYFRAPHIYVALPTRFVPERGSSTDVLFMATRAGTHAYERLFTEAFIRPGMDPARWGNRSNYVALNVVPTGPGEMSIYHEQSGHRYVLRTDGFISVRAGAEKGELLSRPLIYAGDELVVNYSTSAAGNLRVELQDADGTPLPGFSLNDCPLIVGDAIEEIVQWKGGPDLGAWAGKPVRLRLVMVECDLYSFRFRGRQP